MIPAGQHSHLSRTPEDRQRSPTVDDAQPGAMRSREKFLRIFPGGFSDSMYLDWERDSKAHAHGRWAELLERDHFRAMLEVGEHAEIARRAVAIESRTNLLFSFEKMALREAVREVVGARAFAQG